MMMDDVTWAGARGMNAANLPKIISGFAPVKAWGDYALPSDIRPAAVAMLFIPGLDSQAPSQLVLTRRSLKVRTHKGQIGFPGGRAEAVDGSPAVTALRELEEELGVPRDLVKVHGVLPPLPSLDGRPVFTVLATAALHHADFVPAPDEVEAIMVGPWTAFQRSADQAFEFNIFGNWRQSHLFHLGEERVWGLTAKILFDANLG